MVAAKLAIDPQDATRGLRDESRLGAGEIGLVGPPVCRADLLGDDLTGLMLGPYALGSKIGMGGMGQVYSARHRQLDKPFAIKFIGDSLATQPAAKQRFQQEIKALGRLQHPHVVSAVDAGTLDGLPYLVTEFVTGSDFAQLVKRHGEIAVAEACDLVRQAAIGLQYIHREGFLHRDIKPSNLILDQNGIVKILDFGLVRAAQAEQLTEQGTMLGTWDYVPPEQAQDARLADARSDIYSLGCTLLFLLSGQAPFSQGAYSTAAAKLKGHLFDQPRWLANAPAHIPLPLVGVISQMLEKSPAKRLQTAEEVAAALTPFAKDAQPTHLLQELSSKVMRPTTPGAQPFSAKRKGFAWKIGGALAVVGGVASWGWFNASQYLERNQPQLRRERSAPSPVVPKLADIASDITKTSSPPTPLAPNESPTKVAPTLPATENKIADHPTSTPSVVTQEPKATLNTFTVPGFKSRSLKQAPQVKSSLVD